MIGFYDYTVILTYTNGFLGMMAIYTTLNDQLGLGVVLVALAGICDLFDGAVASTKKRRTLAEGQFGIQIDSLADLISFCVYPTVLGYTLGHRDFVSLMIFGLFVLAGIIRLSYFNVTEMARKEAKKGERCYYEGLPVTSVALILPLLYAGSEFFSLAITPFYLLLLSMIGLMFVSKVKIRKLNLTKILEGRRKTQERWYKNGH